MQVGGLQQSTYLPATFRPHLDSEWPPATTNTSGDVVLTEDVQDLLLGIWGGFPLLLSGTGEEIVSKLAST